MDQATTKLARLNLNPISGTLSALSAEMRAAARTDQIRVLLGKLYVEMQKNWQPDI